MVLFSIATTPRSKGREILLLLDYSTSIDTYLIMKSVKQGAYHYLSLKYDSTWN